MDFLQDAEEEYDGQAPMKPCYTLLRELRHLMREVQPLELLPRTIYHVLADAIGDGTGYHCPCIVWYEAMDHLLMFLMDRGTPAFKTVMEEELVVEPELIEKEMAGIDTKEDLEHMMTTTTIDTEKEEEGPQLVLVSDIYPILLDRSVALRR